MTQPLFTPAMDARLTELREQGVKNARIATLLGCCPDLVRKRVKALQLPKRAKGRAKA